VTAPEPPAGGLARLLLDPRLTLALRLAVGAVFVAASVDRLFDPQPFADAIDDYRILPTGAVDLVAVTLPWIEFLTGLCLLIGVATPGAGLVAATLAGTYLLAIASALARGLEIGCGCFADGGGTLAWRDLWLRAAICLAGAQIAASARALDWPARLLRRPASGRRDARGPTPGA
jgi:putative oxidoreductase